MNTTKLAVKIDIPKEMVIPVEDIVRSIKLPTEKDFLYSPRYEDGNAIEGFTTKFFGCDKNAVGNLNKPQELILSRIITENARKEFDANFIHLPTQLAYEMSYTNNYNFNRNFSSLIYSYSVWLREDIKKGQGVISNPVARNVDRSWVYEGEIIPTEIDEKDTLATLSKANLFSDGGRKKINRGKIDFPFDGEIASVYACWLDENLGPHYTAFSGFACNLFAQSELHTPVFINTVAYHKQNMEDILWRQKELSRTSQMLR